MSNLAMLKRQHREILDSVKSIEFSAAANADLKSVEIAREINLLSGKMKMHLMAEDEFLYPDLAQSEYAEIRAAAQRFNSEMGGLSGEFSSFVRKYNTPDKIKAGKTGFAAESRTLFRKIRERMSREDKDLYPLLSQ